MAWKIGIDGGGTKTECILVDPSGAVVTRHTAPGCSPTLAGAARATEIAREAVLAVRAGNEKAEVSSTLLCMAGSRTFWREFGDSLKGFGNVSAVDDSVPVLELATRGGPGIVLHSGTGSFVAARSLDGAEHYAGGVGWRFGDEGSGYELGRRAVTRSLLEMQGWAPASGLGALVRSRTGGRATTEVASHFHGGPEILAEIASFAPEVLRLAADGDTAAGDAVSESVLRLLALGVAVSDKLFPGKRPDSFRAGVSGRILNHPFSYKALSSKAPFPLVRVTEPPIEGIRLLLERIGR